MLVVSPDEDSRRGKDRARRFIALYLSLFPNIARETGYPAEWLEQLRQTFSAEGVEAAARLVDDATVDALTAAGTPDECQAKIAEYRRAGVDLPVMVALEGAIDQTIEFLGPAPASG